MAACSGPVPCRAKTLTIGVGVLLADDLDGGEQFAQARRRQLALLVEKVALGDQHQTVTLGQFGKRLVDTRQGLDRMGQHLPPGGQDLSDHMRRRLAVAEFHGGLDERQGEALHPIAVERKVAFLRLGQPFLDVSGIGPVGQHLGEPVVGQAEDGLVVPEGVVGIEPDRGDDVGLWHQAKVPPAQPACALVTRSVEAGKRSRA